jgi:hypothetical protein
LLIIFCNQIDGIAMQPNVTTAAPTPPMLALEGGSIQGRQSVLLHGSNSAPHGSTLTGACVRFVASVSAFIALSLMLASI